jgi:peptidoglycan/xylan/chitin deacetylase (PgdA/CDA1 family)
VSTSSPREFTTQGLLTARQKRAIRSAAARSKVGTRSDHQLDNSCSSRIAFTFDDGTSSYRPRLLQVLRDKQVHANFFDNGFRVAANPQWARFQVREGHLELNHTYNHLHMDHVSAATNRAEVLDNENFLASIGAPLTFKGIRPPFGGSNPGVQRTLLEMGYTYFLNRIDASDWLPELTAAQIRDGIVEQLRPGVIIALHDGPADTPAGAATVDLRRARSSKWPARWATASAWSTPAVRWWPTATSPRTGGSPRLRIPCRTTGSSSVRRTCSRIRGCSSSGR